MPIADVYALQRKSCCLVLNRVESSSRVELRKAAGERDSESVSMQGQSVSVCNEASLGGEQRRSSRGATMADETDGVIGRPLARTASDLHARSAVTQIVTHFIVAQI